MATLNICLFSLVFLMSVYFQLFINNLSSCKVDQLPSKYIYSFVQSAKWLAMCAGGSGETNDIELKCQTREVKTCICHQSNFWHMNLPLDAAQTATADSVTCQGTPKITVTEHLEYSCSQYPESTNFSHWLLRLFIESSHIWRQCSHSDHEWSD